MPADETWSYVWIICQSNWCALVIGCKGPDSLALHGRRDGGMTRKRRMQTERDRQTARQTDRETGGNLVAGKKGRDERRKTRTMITWWLHTHTRTHQTRYNHSWLHTRWMQRRGSKKPSAWTDSEGISQEERKHEGEPERFGQAVLFHRLRSVATASAR